MLHIAGFSDETVQSVVVGILIAVTILTTLVVIATGIWLAIIIRAGKVKLPEGVVQIGSTRYVDTREQFWFDMLGATNAGRMSRLVYEALREKGLEDAFAVYEIAEHPDKFGLGTPEKRYPFVSVQLYNAWIEDPREDKEVRTLMLPGEFVKPMHA